MPVVILPVYADDGCDRTQNDPNHNPKLRRLLSYSRWSCRWQPDMAHRPRRLHKNRRKLRGTRLPFLHINNSCALYPMPDVQNEEEEEVEEEKRKRRMRMRSRKKKTYPLNHLHKIMRHGVLISRQRRREVTWMENSESVLAEIIVVEEISWRMSGPRFRYRNIHPNTKFTWCW